MRAIQAWSVMMLVMASAAFGQTASDLGEGLRAELTNTSGVTAIKWWGKAGRTYFVQSSETLLPDSWQFMPVVEAGSNAVHTWNLQTSASKMFVRLVYTDQLYSGAAGDADFDGDGLTNALEVSITGPNTNPFLADTDWDGFGDGAEITAGSNPKSSSSNAGGSSSSGPLNPDAHYRHGIRLNYSWKWMWADYTGSLERPGIADSHHTYAGVYTSTGGYVYGPEHDYTGDKTSEVLSTWNSTAFPPTSLTLYDWTGGQFGIDNRWTEYTNTTSSGKWIDNDMERMTVKIQAEVSPGAPAWARRSVAVIDYLGGYTPEAIVKEGRVVFSASNAKATDGITEHVTTTGEAGSAVITAKLAVNEWHLLNVLDVDIEPVEGMSGTIGDVVPSVQGEKSFVRHFVTPKKSDDLPQDDVELTAGSISVAKFDELFEWDCEGGQEGADSRFWKVSRANTGVTKLKIKTKKTKVVVSEMHVWVVWCDAPTVTASGGAFGPWITPNLGIVGQEWVCTGTWKFTYAIKPVEIYDQANPERPDLRGNRMNPPPGSQTPYIGQAGEFADTAENKWDVSRQMKITVRNPNLIEKSNLRSTFNGTLFDRQPIALDVIPFPTNPVEGNDDPYTTDEDTNPEVARTGDRLAHPVGALSSFDEPRFQVADSWGGPGTSFDLEANFREFCRLELHDGARSTGTFWFRISDYTIWHHYLNSIKSGSVWVDTSSSAGSGHPIP